MLQSAEVQLRFFENRPKKRAIPVRRKYLSKPVSKGVTALNEECHDGVIIQADPIGLRSGINLFAYVFNKPINWIDTDGLVAEAIPVPWTWPWEGAGTAARCNPIGLVVTIVFGMPTSSSTCADFPQPEECKKKDEDCKPPVGTKCYEGPHTSHGHGGLGTHYDIFQMFKVRGTCGWQYLGGKVGKGVLETPPPGMLPCSSYPGFQGRGGR